MKRAAWISLVLLLCLASMASAVDLEGIEVKGGWIWIGNAPADPANPDAAPSPFTTVIGAALPIRFNSFFLLVPVLTYYGAPYGYEYGRVVPVEEEFADSSFVLGLLIEPRAVFDFKIHRELNLGAYVSPTLLARLPARTWGDADRGVIAAYQYSMGRFVYPQVGMYLDWALPLYARSSEAEALNEGEFAEPPVEIGPGIHLVIDLNAYFPLFHAWDSESLPFYDQFMVSGTIGLKFFFDSGQAEDTVR